MIHKGIKFRTSKYSHRRSTGLDTDKHGNQIPSNYVVILRYTDKWSPTAEKIRCTDGEDHYFERVPVVGYSRTNMPYGTTYTDINGRKRRKVYWVEDGRVYSGSIVLKEYDKEAM